jgi:branched-chain amino acid transport system substrate-binding protein
MTKLLSKTLLVCAISFALPAKAFDHANGLSAESILPAKEHGVSETRILFGQVAAMEGPARELGQGIRLGILAAFEELNSAGGFDGRKLELLSYDDGYEPDRSIRQVRRLIEEKGIFALLGSVGTAASAATQPIATQAGVPFIGAQSGARFLRDGALGNVVNIRAPYDAETEEWVRYLVDQRKMKRIAILYQDDTFGRAGLDGVVEALAGRDMELVAKATYPRNTTAVKVALLDIRKSNPDAVVMVGTYKPVAEFIRLADSIGLETTYVAISSVGSAALAAELGDLAKGVLISQVVPLPWDTSIPLVRDYQAAIRAVEKDAEPDFVSLEGYMVGRLVTTALRNAGPVVNRRRFLDSILSAGPFDLGGVKLTFGDSDNQGSDTVFLTFIDETGKVRLLDETAY